ncbi:uncharacterized protein [Gossypium hirsutum]|uniref:Uncharacterized protein isoform X2 n=1 Tax=Gossypium hirsutum TaxID=3635 RepID=A0A1U8N7W9_GOSHI|nr:uncharacterized protein LOC107944579 isoform X2 [Gossypium hirsutum]
MNVSEDESQLSAIARAILNILSSENVKILTYFNQKMSKECLEKVTQTISFLAQPRESHLLLLTDLSPFQRQFPLFSIEYRFSSGLTGHSTWAFQLLLLFSTSEVVCCSLQLS